ncbi:MAG: signal peptidase I, partial [Planctomycetota bacterium]
MKGVAAVIRENIEAFAVAIAMALVIRHFCLEAFRIPTGSMKPTLYGNHFGPAGDTRHGDRILVDKLGYLLRDPRRFDVAVFQYPLNRNRNFIKRIGGLGGDWIRLIDGDIWVSRDQGKTWAIARKPAGVRDQLLIDYYPEPTDREAAYRRGGNWKVGFG